MALPNDDKRTVVVTRREAWALFMLTHGVAKGDIRLPPFRADMVHMLDNDSLTNRFLAAAFAEEGDVPDDMLGLIDIDSEWADKWAKWAASQPPTDDQIFAHSEYEELQGSDNDNADE